MFENVDVMGILFRHSILIGPCTVIIDIVIVSNQCTYSSHPVQTNYCMNSVFILATIYKCAMLKVSILIASIICNWLQLLAELMLHGKIRFASA